MWVHPIHALQSLQKKGRFVIIIGNYSKWTIFHRGWCSEKIRHIYIMRFFVWFGNTRAASNPYLIDSLRILWNAGQFIKNEIFTFEKTNNDRILKGLCSILDYDDSNQKSQKYKFKANLYFIKKNIIDFGNQPQWQIVAHKNQRRIFFLFQFIFSLLFFCLWRRIIFIFHRTRNNVWVLKT